MMMMVRRRLMVLLIAVLVGVFSTGFIPLPSPGIISVLARGGGGGADPVCGNNVTEVGETCDDGNTTSGDGCSSVCQTESGDADGTWVAFSGSTLDTEFTNEGVERPHINILERVDTSTWTYYDPTCRSDDSGCTAATGFTTIAGDAVTVEKFPASWGCTPMSTAAADNATSYNCLMGGGESGSTHNDDEFLLAIPNGTYTFTSTLSGNANVFMGVVYKPTRFNHNRGTVGQSRTGVVLDMNPAPMTQMALWGDQGESTGGSAVSWNSGDGAAKGTTEIVVADATNFSAVEFSLGNYVKLVADPLSNMSPQDRVRRARITNIDGNTLTIEQPLDEDFTGGNATAQAINPPSNHVFRRLTIQYPELSHPNSSVYYMSVYPQHMAKVDIEQIVFDGGYRQQIRCQSTMELRIVASDFINQDWDKGANGYVNQISGCDDFYYFNNHFEIAGTAVAFNDNSNGYFGFNDVRGQEPACVDVSPEDGWCDGTGDTVAAFDVRCQGNHLNGGGNDCLIAPAVSFHSEPVHGPTTGGGYLHCSSNDSDVLGQTGDTACHGVGPGPLYSGTEMHGVAPRGIILERNYQEGSFWVDNDLGPGRDHILFGNWFPDSTETGTVAFATSPGGLGDALYWRASDGSSPFYNGGCANNNDTGSRSNMQFINNLVEGDLGGGGGGADTCGDGMRFTDNVIQGSCRLSQTGLSGDVCTIDAGDSAPAGVSGVWSFNTVDQTTHSSPRSMPTSLVHPTQPDFGLTPTATLPFVGPEMGDAATTDVCLPAWQRANGGSC